MPSTTARDDHVVETRSISHNHGNAQETMLREDRMHRYLEEPMSDGNRSVLLSGPQTSTSYQYTTTMTGVDMATKIDKVMKPFHAAGGGR
ncbi:hypothetical protein LQW54_013390 [Pestalotiopsis sp. IQ-011]